MDEEESTPMGQGATGEGELIAMSEQDENTRIIDSMVDFYHTLRALKINACCPEVENFCRAFENINKGCGCTRKNRVKNTETLYVGMGNLSDENKQLIKDALSVDKVMLIHETGLFSEF